MSPWTHFLLLNLLHVNNPRHRNPWLSLSTHQVLNWLSSETPTCSFQPIPQHNSATIWKSWTLHRQISTSTFMAILLWSRGRHRWLATGSISTCIQLATCWYCLWLTLEAFAWRQSTGSWIAFTFSCWVHLSVGLAIVFVGNPMLWVSRYLGSNNGVSMSNRITYLVRLFDTSIDGTLLWQIERRNNHVTITSNLLFLLIFSFTSKNILALPGHTIARKRLLAIIKIAGSM